MDKYLSGPGLLCDRARRGRFPDNAASAACRGNGCHASPEMCQRAGARLFVFRIPRGPLHWMVGDDDRPTGVLADLLPAALFDHLGRPPYFFDELYMSAVGRAAFSVEPVETFPQRIRGNVAALDVLDREPLPANHPLCSAPNVVMAPHLGCGLQEIRAGFYPQSCRTRWRSWTARRCGSPSLGRWGRWVSTAASAALRG